MVLESLMSSTHFSCLRRKKIVPFLLSDTINCAQIPMLKRDLEDLSRNMSNDLKYWQSCSEVCSVFAKKWASKWFWLGRENSSVKVYKRDWSEHCRKMRRNHITRPMIVSELFNQQTKDCQGNIPMVMVKSIEGNPKQPKKIVQWQKDNRGKLAQSVIHYSNSLMLVGFEER